MLNESIMFKDGMLAVALGWLFNRQEVKWQFSVHNKYENDFVCDAKDGRMLFECKMHILPKDKRSLQGQIKQDITALTTHVETLLTEGAQLSKVHLVYNYDLEDYPHENIKQVLDSPKLKKSLRQFNINLIGFPEVQAVLEAEGFSNLESTEL